MSTAAPSVTCSCYSIGRSDLRLCEEHHRYWNGDKELTSVSKIIRSCWPVKKNFEDAPPDILEHARERGIRIDRHFSQFLNTGYLSIRAGDEWEEVRLGLLALVNWWTKREEFNQWRENIGFPFAQVILADSQVAGTADIVFDGKVFDVKCVSALDPTYDMQLGAYADIHGGITEGFLVHCKVEASKHKASVNCVPVDMKQAVTDWRHMREVWMTAQRRTK